MKRVSLELKSVLDHNLDMEFESNQAAMETVLTKWHLIGINGWMEKRSQGSF